MNYYSIFIVLIIAGIAYSALKTFSKPTVIDCGDYKVQSKNKKELQTANMVQFYHFNIEPLFEAHFIDADKVYFARNMYFDLYKARGGFVEAKDLQIIINEVDDLFYKED